MFPIPLATTATAITDERFWNAILLYYNRPHLINRKIITPTSSSIFEVKFHSNSTELSEHINRASILYELRKLKEASAVNIKKDFLSSLLCPYDDSVQIKEVTIEELKLSSTDTFLSTRILYPRMKNSLKAIEVVIWDKKLKTVTFLAVSDSDKTFMTPPFPYQIELTPSNNLKVNLATFENADTAHAEWLGDKLFLKLLKWADEDLQEGQLQSLSLVNAEEYCLTYNKLKSVYGAKLVQDWPKKAGTDPQKYVFEDIAIASYLMCLWKDETDVSFVDCGCGNGLLVHLLTREGFKGFGIDVRSRNTWDLYEKSTTLQVNTIGPDSFFPTSTWIIGNHSDELTPWIPVIALKSAANFFLLPCCPYDFNGQKFIRQNTGISTYADYLTYIEGISKQCGFETFIDKLRIPSTKRTCLVGMRKETGREDLENTKRIINSFVQSKTSENFVQRTDVEKVRNCTQLNKNLISNIVNICVKKILSSENYIEKSNGDMWNLGSQVEIISFIHEIPREFLKQLKQECGGLQTILRNHRYLFMIQNGLVNLRVPPNIRETTKYKNKPCWFAKNHPNGCLHEPHDCSYSHE